jgi:MFS family permease
VWGRVADWSSRRVLVVATLAGAAALALAAVGPPALLPAVLVLLLVAHQGLRLGRKTHLVDMAPRDDRAAYTAIANTAAGVLLLAGGGFGWLAAAAGPAVVLAVMAAMALGAAAVAAGLREAQVSAAG